MLLTVLERLALMDCLPKEGNIVTLRTVRELREALSFGQDAERFGLQQNGGQITWDPTVDQEAEIPLTGAGIALIVEALRALDGAAKLTEREVSLWDKFLT